LSTGKLVVRIRLGARHNVCGIFASARPIKGGNGLIVSFGEVMPMRLGRLQ
jgi:hypothetical protein